MKYALNQSFMTLTIIIVVGYGMAHASYNKQWIDLLQAHPFSYDLGVKIIPSDNPDAQIMICAHGYGHSNKIADVVKKSGVVNDHIISFNFPDYRIMQQTDRSQVSFGTINELLPLLYILKRCVIDLNIPVINLYGFSAGGAAVINALAVLNHKRFDKELQALGIGADEIEQIIASIKKGCVILNCPLKSIEEIIALRGSNPEFEFIASNYARNQMRPIESIERLAGLELAIVLHFQNPDEVLGNRDDALFIERLRSINKDTTVIIGSEGGHNAFHATLWQRYNLMKN